MVQLRARNANQSNSVVIVPSKNYISDREPEVVDGHVLAGYGSSLVVF